MTNGSSQGLYVIVAVVIFGIFVGASYLLFRDIMKPALTTIFCESVTLASKATGFSNGVKGCDISSSKEFKISYHKIRDEHETGAWSEAWVQINELDNGSVEIIDSGDKDLFEEGEIGENLVGDISFPDEIDGRKIEVLGKGAFQKAKFTNVMKLPQDLIILDDYSLQQSLFSGSAVFPDKIEIFGEESLRDSKFTGKLSDLPKSIIEIGEGAFKESEFEGSFVFPNGDKNFDGSLGSGAVGGNGDANNNGSNDGSDGGNGGNTDGENGDNNNNNNNNNNSNIGTPSTIIGDGAFENSKFTGKIDVPNFITEIGDNAFKNSEFSQIVIPPTSDLTEIGDGAFENSKATGTLYLPNSVKYIGDSAFLNSKFINKDWNMPTNLEYIGDLAFKNSVMTGNLKMFGKLKTIGISSFENSFKASVTHTGISYGTVTSTVSTKHTITLPDSVESIGMSAFENAVFQGNFTIPKNTTFIGAYAFRNSFQNYSISDKYVRTETAPNGWSWKRYYYQYFYIAQPEFKLNDKIEYIGSFAFENAHFKDVSTTNPEKLNDVAASAFKYSFGTTSVNEKYYQSKYTTLKVYPSMRGQSYNLQNLSWLK